MGYISIISVYNDGVQSILENCEEFCKNLVDAIEESRMTNKPSTLSHHTKHAFYANFGYVQPPRHSTQETCYIFKGNGVSEMSGYSLEMRDRIKNKPELFREKLEFMKNEVKKLEIMLKDHEASNPKE